MRPPAHVLHAGLLVTAYGIAVEQVIQPWIYGEAIVLSLVTDSDSPYSLAGKACPQLSRWVEKRCAGHRGWLHTLNAVMCFACLTFPLYFVHTQAYICGVLAILSHWLLDASSKSGVPLFWRSRWQAVFPRSANLRIRVGSRAELGLCVFLLLLLSAAIYLNRIGVQSMLRTYLGQVSGAVAEYERHCDDFIMWAEVDGRWTASQESLDTHFVVLGLLDRQTLAVFDVMRQEICSVGRNLETATIWPERIRCFPGKPVEIETQSVRLENCLLENLLESIPEKGVSTVSGRLQTSDWIPSRPDLNAYQTIRMNGSELELRFALRKHLGQAEIAKAFVNGTVIIRNIVKKAESEPEPSLGFELGTNDTPLVNVATKLQGQEQPVSDFPVEITVTSLASLDDLLVVDGQIIPAGTLLVRRSALEEEMLIEERNLEAKMAVLEVDSIDSSELRLAELVLRLARDEWKNQQDAVSIYENLYASQAIPQQALIKEEIALKEKSLALQKAQTQLKKTRRALAVREQVKQAELLKLRHEVERFENQETNMDVRTPFRARVLEVRPERIRDGNFQARIRLLPLEGETVPQNFGGLLPLDIEQEKNTKQKRRQ